MHGDGTPRPYPEMEPKAERFLIVRRGVPAIAEVSPTLKRAEHCLRWEEFDVPGWIIQHWLGDPSVAIGLDLLNTEERVYENGFAAYSAAAEHGSITDVA